MAVSDSTEGSKNSLSGLGRMAEDKKKGGQLRRGESPLCPPYQEPPASLRAAVSVAGRSLQLKLFRFCAQLIRRSRLQFIHENDCRRFRLPAWPEPSYAGCGCFACDASSEVLISHSLIRRKATWLEYWTARFR